MVDDNASLLNKVMTWEAEALAAMGFLKEAKLAKDEEIAKAKRVAMANYQGSEEFATLLKKECDIGYDEGYDASMEAIFYNISKKHWDIDYKLLGKEFIKLMDQWLEVQRLNTLNIVPSSPLAGPSAKNSIVMTEVAPVEAHE